jgi:hypothetical protein
MPGANGAVAGTVAAVAEFGDAYGDRAGATQDLLDGVGTVRAGCSVRLQHQCLLRFADELLNVGARIDGVAEFVQDQLGGAFDEFLGGADDEARAGSSCCSARRMRWRPSWMAVASVRFARAPGRMSTPTLVMCPSSSIL